MDMNSADEEVETKLDLEFRRILRIIKIYVPCIMNVDYLTSYRLWLEKLSEADITDKQERNRYLIELCRQIQDGILEKPFRQRPVPGPLPPLRRNLSSNKEQLQQHQQQQTQHQEKQQKQLQEQQQKQQQEQQHKQQQEQLQQQQLLQQHQQQQQQQLLQLQQQQLQQQKLQQQQQHQHQQLLQLQQQQRHVQEQQQQQQFFEDVIPVKQESFQNTIAKELNRVNKPSTSKQDVQNYQDNSEYQNYLKGFSKTPHTVERDVQVTKDNEQKPKLIVLKNPPPSELPNTSTHKKRNQHTVLKEIQEHVRNSNRCKEPNNVLADLASKFPSYVDTRQYVESQQSYCYSQENQQQNVSYQQQESQSPHSMYMKHPDSFSGNQACLKNTSQHQKITNMNIRINNEDIEEESSWCDMSDTSRTATFSRMESGDSANSLIPRLTPHLMESTNSISPSKIHEMCENKIKDLVNIVTELKRQNLSLNAKAEVIIQNLADEVNLLKLKEHKINEMKSALKKTHSVASAQWKNTITDLKQTLHNAQHEILTLQNEIVGLKEKLEDFSSKKQQDNVTIRQRLADMYDKEIEMLKQNYVRHIVDIENKFTQILNEKEAAFNQKLNDLKELYDRKIADITRGISDFSTERCTKGPEKCFGKSTIGKKPIIPKILPEKEPFDKMEKKFDEKRPWRKRLIIGSYKLTNS